MTALGNWYGHHTKHNPPGNDDIVDYEVALHLAANSSILVRTAKEQPICIHFAVPGEDVARHRNSHKSKQSRLTQLVVCASLYKPSSGLWLAEVIRPSHGSLQRVDLATPTNTLFGHIGPVTARLGVQSHMTTGSVIWDTVILQWKIPRNQREFSSFITLLFKAFCLLSPVSQCVACHPGRRHEMEVHPNTESQATTAFAPHMVWYSSFHISQMIK